jgi:hypothetical protein
MMTKNDKNFPRAKRSIVEKINLCGLMRPLKYDYLENGELDEGASERC